MAASRMAAVSALRAAKKVVCPTVHVIILNFAVMKDHALNIHRVTMELVCYVIVTMANAKI